MAIGILCLFGGLIYIAVGLIGDKVTIHEAPHFDNDQDFWDYYTTLAGITDIREKRRFETETKRKQLQREREKQIRK